MAASAMMAINNGQRNFFMVSILSYAVTHNKKQKALQNKYQPLDIGGW